MHTQSIFTRHEAQANTQGTLNTGGTRHACDDETRTWQPRTKKHVTDLLDDASALEDWHRNLERLRNPEHS